MKIFVTGATGFIGSYVIRQLLNEGYKNINAIKRKSSKLHLVEDVAHHVQWIDCDLFNIPVLDDYIKNADAIIHVAGMISFSERNRKAVFKTNVEGTANLINIALCHNVKRFIHFSSVAALGNSKNQIDESMTGTEISSKSIYSLSKYFGEREAWRGYAEGLNLSIINPSLVLGASYWDFGPLEMIKRLDKGLKFYPVGINGVVDVRDVAKMCSLLLAREDMTGTRFICSAENISYLDLMKMICDLLGRPYPKVRLEGTIGQLAWLTEIAKSYLLGSDTLFSKEAYKISSAELRYDNSQSKKLLHFQYQPLDQTIGHMVNCYLESKENGISYGILNS